MIPRLVTADVAAAEDFYADALARGHEGVMAKALDAPYEAGSRGASWLKVKRAHTLDLVVLAAEWGHGRRQRLAVEPAPRRARPGAGGFVMLGKTFKGMTDAMLEWQTRELLARETGRDGYIVHVRPELVVEIAFNDLQASPQYPGGLALRFARVKGYRADKRRRGRRHDRDRARAARGAARAGCDLTPALVASSGRSVGALLDRALVDHAVPRSFVPERARHVPGRGLDHLLREAVDLVVREREVERNRHRRHVPRRLARRARCDCLQGRRSRSTRNRRGWSG